MAGQATVLAVGGATVPASGFYTAQGIVQVQALIATASVPGGAQVVIYDPAASIPAVPPGLEGKYVLVVPNNAGGTFTVPHGYGAVVLGQNTDVVVRGGDATTAILSAGALDYQGAAGLVDASSGEGKIVDSAVGGVIDLGGGSYTVTGAGDRQTIQVDNGKDFINAAGVGDNILLGDGPPFDGFTQLFPGASAISGSEVTVSGSNSKITVNGTGYLLTDNRGAGANTITGAYGSVTVFAANNDMYVGAGAVVEFIGSGSAQTVIGGSGADVVFGQAGQIVYNEGGGSGHIFVGGTVPGVSQATVNGAGSGLVFGGSGSTLLNLGNATDTFIAGVNGRDSIFGGSTVATVFGNSNETLSIVGTHYGLEMAVGSNNVLDATQSYGGNNFFALASGGNTTLMGSAIGTGIDTFNIATAAGAQAHSVVIDNWRSGDGVFLSGYSANDVQAMDAAVNAGSASFSLSDGTTVTFNGAHPMHAVGTVAY